MISRKQYPNHRVYETEIGGRPYTGLSDSGVFREV